MRLLVRYVLCALQHHFSRCTTLRSTRSYSFCNSIFLLFFFTLLRVGTQLFFYLNSKSLPPSPVIFFVYQIFPQNCELSYTEFYLNHLETTYILSQVLVPSSPGLLLLYTNSSLFCHCSFVKWRQRQGKSD